jgi:single-stranded-DNA-specific exonuclease
MGSNHRLRLCEPPPVPLGHTARSFNLAAGLSVPRDFRSGACPHGQGSTVDTGDDQDLLAARRLLGGARFVCPHTDADGLAAGAIALRARGEGASKAVLLGRGSTPFDPDALPAARPAAILDWGVRPFDGEALLVDHHFPEAEPARGQIVVSGYGRSPEVSTSVLMGEMVPSAPQWLVAVGAVGDLGDRAWHLDHLRGVTKSHIRKLVPLVNAPRRGPNGPVSTALEILVGATDARAALADPRIEILEDAKARWREAFAAALRIAPQVEAGLAVIRISSPYQIHPLVAQTWANRLAPDVVLVANADYIPGRVNFAVRGGSGDLRTKLREALPLQTGEFAHGHDRATGGSLPADKFEELVHALRGQA